jgi:hypothetical protein
LSTTSTIGTSSRNYSTITAWLAAFANGGWIGQCYNDSEFTQAAETFPINFNQTTSAANFVTLQTATGQSFRDAGSPRLGYDITKGVGVANNGAYGNAKSFAISSDYVTFQYLQVKATAGTASQPVLKNDSGNSIDHAVVDSCIFESTNSNTGSSCGVIRVEGGETKNCLCVNRSNSANGVGINVGHAATGGSVFNVDNCTVVAPSDLTQGADGFFGSYNTTVVTNCTSFGFAAVLNNTARFTGSDYFGTDQSTVGVGTHNVTSATFNTSNFVTTVDASHDYRIVTGSALKEAGFTNSTNVSPAKDIIGTSRPQGSSWDIGAYEYPSGAPVVTKRLMMHSTP